MGSEEEGGTSNLEFGEGDVRRGLEGVVEQVEMCRGERMAWIVVAAAVQARCCALGIVCVDEGRQIEASVEAGFNLGGEEVW